MKKILITGSTDGIGKLAAIKLAKEGHTLYLHGRSKEKLSKAIEEVKKASDNENVSGFTADFADLSEVRKMADLVNNELNQLDVLINNAGVYNSATAVNQDGSDMRIVVNYLAPFLLTKELMPLLKNEAPRIINLASAAQAPVNLAVLSGRIRASERDAYAQSKLALIMWSFHLANVESDKTVIAVNPGSLLHTKMVLEAFGDSWSPADKGADILAELATLPEYESESGKYFDNDNGGFREAHPYAYSQSKVDAVMQVTEDLLSNI